MKATYNFKGATYEGPWNLVTDTLEDLYIAHYVTPLRCEACLLSLVLIF